MAIDLRSDTVTRPTEGMKQAMLKAEVGDDVYGEDPTVRHLEERVAEVLGKGAGLFVTSGTMGNQLGLLLHSQRGDEVYTGEGSHCIWYESGAAGALSGVQLVEVGHGGSFSGEELAAALKPRAYWCPQPRVVVVENTHNRGGGKIFPNNLLEGVVRVARAHDLALHLDGARLWNAAAASGRSERELAAEFDTATVCFSKGLGAPVGSVLVGSSAAIQRARRLRKMLGGGMRQAGFLAAACLYALDHHRVRLGHDHANARRLAKLARDSGLASVAEPETNIVMIDLPESERGPLADEVIRALAEHQVLVSGFGPNRIRAVTHLDVDDDSIERAGRAIQLVLRQIVAA